MDNRAGPIDALRDPDALVSTAIFAAQTLAVTSCAVMAWGMEPLREVECASLMLLFSLVVYTMVLPKPRLLRIVAAGRLLPLGGQAGASRGDAANNNDDVPRMLRQMTMPGRPFAGSSP